MCDLEELENQPVAPVTSMLPKTAMKDIIHANGIEQFWNPALHHVPKPKLIHHTSELIISRPTGAEGRHQVITATSKIGREENGEFSIHVLRS
jgi:hypothetical protein